MADILLECNSKTCRGRVQDFEEIPVRVHGRVAYRCEVCNVQRYLGGIAAFKAAEKRRIKKLPRVNLPNWKDKIMS